MYTMRLFWNYTILTMEEEENLLTYHSEKGYNPQRKSLLYMHFVEDAVKKDYYYQYKIIYTNRLNLDKIENNLYKLGWKKAFKCGFNKYIFRKEIYTTNYKSKFSHETDTKQDKENEYLDQLKANAIKKKINLITIQNIILLMSILTTLYLGYLHKIIDTSFARSLSNIKNILSLKAPISNVVITKSNVINYYGYAFILIMLIILLILSLINYVHVKPKVKLLEYKTKRIYEYAQIITVMIVLLLFSIKYIVTSSYNYVYVGRMNFQSSKNTEKIHFDSYKGNDYKIYFYIEDISNKVTIDLYNNNDEKLISSGISYYYDDDVLHHNKYGNDPNSITLSAPSYIRISYDDITDNNINNYADVAIKVSK